MSQKGLVYVFLRKDGAPLPVGCAGHVAWGFAVQGQQDLDAVAGATENYKGIADIPPGGDTGFWWTKFPADREMFQEMSRRNYDGYKVATVRDFNADAALSIARDTAGRGYNWFNNNCLNHVWDILKAYGVDDLPLTQFHPSPNDWFAQFNGEYHNL